MPDFAEDVVFAIIYAAFTAAAIGLTAFVATESTYIQDWVAVAMAAAFCVVLVVATTREARLVAVNVRRTRRERSS